MCSRLEKFTELFSNSCFEAIAINAGSDLQALTGLNFHLSERPVVLFYKPGKLPALVCPQFEIEKTKNSSIPLNVFTYPEDTEKWTIAFKAAIESLGLRNARIAVSPTSFRMLEFSFCNTVSENNVIIPDAKLFSALRIIKNNTEIDLIRKAIEIAEHALKNTLREIQINMSEREIAGRLTQHLFLSGSDPELPFSPIVASGENSANPHAIPSQRMIKNGDVLLIDWGARYGGYVSDLTRCFFIGEHDQKMQQIADLVIKANQTARDVCQNGSVSGEIDDAARKVIHKAGYGEFFTHRTGHGIGLEAHEEPYIQAGSSTILRHGMIFTIEPGIYVPGLGGIRIEDNIFIGEHSGETLSSFPRQIGLIH